MNNIKNIIETSYEKSNAIITTVDGTIGSINTYSISDEIIKNTGRFCERYLSDCLITLNHMSEICHTPVEKETIDYICFGIRTDGVDSNAYIQNRIEMKYESNNKNITNEWIKLYYRRLFAVKITRKPDDWIKCELKDISNNLYVSDDKLY